MRPEDAEIIRDLAAHEPDKAINLEIELVFSIGAIADRIRAQAIADIQKLGGT